MSIKTAILEVSILLAGIFCLATGWTDLDWMIVCNHFMFGQGGSVTWEFCPFLKMNWWLAFEFTLGRIIAGSVMIGGFLDSFIRKSLQTKGR